MADFLDCAKDLLYRKVLTPDDAKHFERVFAGIASLQSVHSKVALNLRNLESVLATFEMGRTLGRLGNHNESEIAGLVESLRVVIARTLEHSLRFNLSAEGFSPPHHYFRFGKLVERLVWDLKPRESVSVLTFNYDLALDHTLGFEGSKVGYSYCLDGAKPEGSIVPLLKLHGSVNWWLCPNCKAITPVDVPYQTRIPSNLRTAIAPQMPDQSMRFFASRVGRACKLCKASLTGEPFLVPPSWGKNEHRETIQPVWRRAAEELREAEHVFVLGFSFAASDGFFEQLLGLGTAGGKPLRRFCVFDPDPAVADRFRAALGPGALSSFSTPSLASRRTFPMAIQCLDEMFDSGALTVL
jgi:hypothetical protein